jgi:hypothetical protein
MTTATDRHTFREVVADIAAKAKARLPEAVNGRIEKATTLVLTHDVAPQPDGSIIVGSGSDPLRSYRLEGTTCECQDFQYGRAPEGWCAHRIAAGIHKRVCQVLDAQAAQEPQEGAAPVSPVVDTPAAVSTPHDLPEAPASTSGLDPRHIVQLQGKPFVTFAGLLQLAHERGLVELSAVFTQSEASLALAHAVAIFEDERRFEESADSTPENAKRVGPHWRRMALTRAKARALRDALSVDMCSVEEMD